MASGERASLSSISLHAQRTLQCFDRTRELCHQSIAGVREYTTVRSMDFADETIQRGIDPSMRRLFGGIHQQTIVANVRAEDCSKPAPYASASGTGSERAFGWRDHPGMGRSCAPERHDPA